MSLAPLMYPVPGIQYYVPFLYVRSDRKMGNGLIDSQLELFGGVWRWPHQSSILSILSQPPYQLQPRSEISPTPRLDQV